jgi:hypothetical protein
MGGARSTSRGEKYTQGFSGKLEGEISLGKLRCRWEDNIKRGRD